MITLSNSSNLTNRLKRLDWIHISSLLSICQTNSLNVSSINLGVSKSTLSERLKKLEEVLGLTLFDRVNNKIFPNESGLYLAKFLMPLMVIENYSFSERVNCENLAWVSVRFPLRIYGQRLCRAIEKTIKHCQKKFPNILYWPQSFDSFESRSNHEFGWQPSIDKIGNIDLNWIEYKDIKEGSKFIDGKWCLIHHQDKDFKTPLDINDLRKFKISIPRLPWNLLNQLSDIVERNDLNAEFLRENYHFCLREKGALNKVYLSHTLLVDEDLLSTGWKITCLDLEPQMKLFIGASNLSEPLTYFLDTFTEIYDNTDLVTWNTKSQLKNWIYFHTSANSKSITEAAEKTFMTQAALSIQLKDTEQLIGHTLIKRKVGSTTHELTKTGEIFSNFCDGVICIFNSFFDRVSRLKKMQLRHISFGILPSIDNQSSLANMMVNTVEEWLKNNPDVVLEIYEERHKYLVDSLRAHELNLAVIEADSPWVVNIPVGKPEEMGLVIKPDRINSKVKWLDWEEIKNLDLVLPRKENGMRILIDQHCNKLGINLKIGTESDSLNLNQIWVLNGKYATILPESAVKNLIKSKKLRFIPLRPTLNRVLRIAYLNNKILSSTETSLIKHMRNVHFMEKI